VQGEILILWKKDIIQSRTREKKTRESEHSVVIAKLPT